MLAKAMNELVKDGSVMIDAAGKGKSSLRQDFTTFKKAFGLCAADGKETDFLATAYSKAVLSDDVFPILTKEFVRSAILSTLLLLTMSPVDRSRKSSLLLLHRTVYSDTDTTAAIQGIAGSLEAIGFQEALKKSLATLKTKQDENAALRPYADKKADMERRIATLKEQLEQMNRIVPTEKEAAAKQEFERIKAMMKDKELIPDDPKPNMVQQAQAGKLTPQARKDGEPAN